MGGFYAGAAGGDSLLAELQAMAMGLRFLWCKNFRKIICGTHCLESV